MVIMCTVCMNNTRKTKNISYFIYPKDETKRQKWLKAVGREDLLAKIVDYKTLQYYKICEHHFERSCIRFSKTKKFLVNTAFPTLNLPINDGACLSSSQCEKVSIQENQNNQFIPTTEISLSSNNPLNKIVILEDQTSRNIQKDLDKQTCESISAQTAIHLSADNPRKRILSLELREAKRHKERDLDNKMEIEKGHVDDIDDIDIDYDNIDRFGEQIAFLLKRIPRNLCKTLQDSIVTLVKTETKKYESKIKSNATKVNIKQEAEEFTTEDELENMADDDEIPVKTTQATHHIETQLKTDSYSSTIKIFPKPMTVPIELVESMDCVKQEILDTEENSNTVQEQYNKSTPSENVDCVNKEVLDPEESRNITVEEEYNEAPSSELTLSDPLETDIKIEIDETSWLR